MTEAAIIDPVVAPAAAIVDPTAGQTPPANDPAPNGNAADPAAAPAAVDPKNISIAAGGDPAAGDPKAAAVPATWPDDWREKYSKEDAKKLELMKRYASPEAALDALIATKDKLSKGGLKEPLPENATKEQVAEWRKENGIPEHHKDYDLNIEGLAIGEAYKPYVDKALQYLHAENMPPEFVKAAIATYFSINEESETAIIEKRQQFATEANNQLRAEWGADFKKNQNIVKSFVESSLGSDANTLFNATAPDGTFLGDNPAVLRFLVDVATQIDPTRTVVPNGGMNGAQAVEDELATISNFRKTNLAAYYKDEKMQARERDLIDARSKMQARG